MRTRARRVAVCVFDEVELLDVAAPVEVLSLAGRRWNFRAFKIELVASSPGWVTTRNQTRLEATRTFEDALGADIVVVPGGYGARRCYDGESLGPELVSLIAGAELVAAIGWGVALIARAGVAGGARVAAPEEARAAISARAPDAELETDAPLMRSGRLHTARASGAALELGLQVVAATLGPKLSQMVRADLGLEGAPSAERIEIRYEPKA